MSGREGGEGGTIGFFFFYLSFNVFLLYGFYFIPREISIFENFDLIDGLIEFI